MLIASSYLDHPWRRGRVAGAGVAWLAFHLDAAGSSVWILEDMRGVPARLAPGMCCGDSGGNIHHMELVEALPRPALRTDLSAVTIGTLGLGEWLHTPEFGQVTRVEGLARVVGHDLSTLAHR